MLIQHNDEPASLIPADTYLSSEEVMTLLGYKTPGAFYYAVHASGIPHVKITRKRVLFPKNALYAWLNSRTLGRVAA